VVLVELSIAITRAIRMLMTKQGMKAGDTDLREPQQACAETTLCDQRELRTPWESTNVSGGAIALGHAHGMSGNSYV
jgi:acetyl-CoA C-acetyltransferase